ncbi:ATP-binding protein [Streptomyces sp. S.PB5]|uniref:ATP-binding protein n=1 Tax=Streptomyces sp. S.PB5 TaxID=3020844 RepID=UPI0025B0E474|nr:ATP-binding protein [Streptomyces sp. S.PB5]MDN3026006.1 ATP-binding protein [Streptomyces sp. S.PB5]
MTRDLMRVAEARRMCGAKLRHWGFEQLIDPALLLLSELVTNALRHGSEGRIGVRLSHTHRDVRIEVRGGPVKALTARTPDPLDEGGRGLLLVDTIADVWGVDETGWVWCTIAMASHSS